MKKHESKYGTLKWLIEEVKWSQLELVREILSENGIIGGCIGTITGPHGRKYDLESIYLSGDNGDVVCHLDYPAFEADADFEYLSLDERQQIIDLLVEYIHEQDDSETSTMYVGVSAKAILHDILNNFNGSNYPKHKGTTGYFNDENGVWVAFDNTNCDCWVEEFSTDEDAIDWIKNGPR